MIKNILLKNLLSVISGTLLFVVFNSAILNGQKPYESTGWTGFKLPSYNKSVTDTIDSNFNNATPTIYSSPNGGFVSGNSGFNELAKAQEFDFDSLIYPVEGFLFWFGYKEQQSLDSDSSSIMLHFWRMDSTAVIGGITRFIPRTVLASQRLLIKDLDTSMNFASGVNVWMFPPIDVYINYAGGFTMDNLHVKDTIALYSSTDGDPPVPTLSWELWNGTWNTIYNAWGLDIDFAVFPVVDFSTIGIEQHPYVNSLRMEFAPNPAREHSRLDYSLSKPGMIDLMIFDASGTRVAHRQLGWHNVGTYSTNLELEGLNPGTYFVSLGLNSRSRLTRKLMKIE